MYKLLTIDNKEYKCVLSAAACVEAEQRLGKNPLEVFMEGMPQMKDMLIVFHASLIKYQHNIKLEDAYDLYDSYIEEGNSLTDFINLIMEIFKESGFVKPEGDEEKNS